MEQNDIQETRRAPCGCGLLVNRRGEWCNQSGCVKRARLLRDLTPAGCTKIWKHDQDAARAAGVALS
jgi:hypothetical protein